MALFGPGKPDAELEKLLKEHGLQDPDVKEVGDFGLRTVDGFAGYFEPESANANFRAQMFDKVVAWQNKQWVL